MAKGMKNVISDREWYCVFCGSKGIPIARIRGKEREVGHLKKLYCLKCKCETNHAECENWTYYTHDDFLKEFEGGNFDDDGNRIVSYGMFKSQT